MLTNTNDVFRKASQTKQEMCHWNCSAGPQLCKKNLHWRFHCEMWNTNKHFFEAILIQRNILIWILHQHESWQGKVKLAPACINTQELWGSTFFVYFYQPRTLTRTQITLLLHCTGFPGNWTSFLKLYAAHLIRRLILPWLWPLMVLMPQDKAGLESLNEREWVT